MTHYRLKRGDLIELRLLAQTFAVCRLPRLTPELLELPFFFLARTDDEVSLVCPADAVPADTDRVEPDWRALKIEGVLDFSLVGILAKLSGILADGGISLFAVSTYNTDYILVKQERCEEALALLRKNGYIVT